MKTVKKDGIKITLKLNQDETVDLQKKMKVEYEQFGEKVEQDIYPDVVADKNYGTINTQFDLVKSIMKFDEAYRKATSK